ncbi:MAG: transposase [Gammaproteobacteria bacterium]|nr:MAG: transposase [Gammaproteobacteria bacterium]PHR84901.1 MAG: transposase [Colwellia sp.]
MTNNTNHSYFKIAEYIDPGLPEYADNPLIAALGYIYSANEVVTMLENRPKFDSKEINLKGHVRVHAISRLTRDFFVPQTMHLVLEQKLSQLIRKSYLGRNPKTATFKRKLNQIRSIIQNQDLSSYVHSEINSNASSMAIAGISGAGKSTATNKILNSYDKVIYHPEYQLIQVPWIKIDCPYDGSLSEFCESFFIALDKRLNTRYRDKYTAGRPTIGKLIADVADLCLIHAVGLIVVDEFQHMNLAKSGGEKKMINFLVTLVNVVEVSIVLIGTPTALRLFSNEFRQARRASGEGSIVWDKMAFDENWDVFLGELFQYQWLESHTELDEAFTHLLYNLSQGIPDIAVKLFCIAQAKAILLADSPTEECLTIGLFNDVFEEEFSIVRPMLDALRTNDHSALKNCKDIVIPNIESGLLNGFDHLKAAPLKTPKRIETGDSLQNDVVNNAISTLVSMGVTEDIVRPLVQDCIASNPEVSLIDIIHQATSSFATTNVANTKKGTKKKIKSTINKVKEGDWGQLSQSDLRKVYVSKSDTMYKALSENGHIYPIERLLAG